MNEHRYIGRYLVVFLVILAFAALRASADIADRSLIERIEVAGMTLKTPARDAFKRLKAEGFDMGDLASYEDWSQSGLIAVKGDRKAPDGHFEMVLSRNGDTLVEIREHRIRLAEAFDVAAEIESMRRFFGLEADAKDCKTSQNQKSGSCGVEDPEQTATFLLTFVGDRQRYTIVQRHDLKPAEL